MRIILNGYTGRMGKMVQEAVERTDGFEIVSSAAVNGTENDVLHTHESLDNVSEEADVVIDFSNHLGTKDLMDFCVKHELPVVVCTTGQSEEEKTMIAEASASIPVFFSANMSLGIAVLSDLVKRAAALFPNADIEIVEMHHNQKLDVPSGTALMLAESIKEVRSNAVYNIGRHENGKRDAKEIGIHSLRMGNEVGTHTVYIRTGSECLTLTHEAESRAVFADGALKAAGYLLQQKPGLYTMKDLVGVE